MGHHVVRVKVPTVTEYDVVFDGDRPIFIGAVIRREASAKGPDAGKWVDTHRTTWDGRNGAAPIHCHPQSGAPLGLSSQVIDKAMRILAIAPNTGRDAKLPNQLSRPFKWVRPTSR